MPMPPTSSAAAPRTAWTGIAAAFGDTGTVVAMMIVLLVPMS
ncbi:hypothetical protein QFZ82_007433 [Streptomyces sp. V4I23]|nr:hypothetical protein [Streptomyces sp. V4I23]MDQ1012948.1 hypothetical protein [Streptomyces sp. V4I23]